jgi:hypothetical protein
MILQDARSNYQGKNILTELNWRSVALTDLAVLTMQFCKKTQDTAVWNSFMALFMRLCTCSVLDIASDLYLDLPISAKKV